ncbi:MAG: LTA synthase family protein [Sutterella sp.]|nr:LTA synthase family protein [Sutterella sp.]
MNERSQNTNPQTGEKKHPYLLLFSKCVIGLIYTLAVLCFLAYALARFSIKTFGDLPISQLLFHLTAGGAGHGINPTIRTELIRWGSLFGLVWLILTVLLCLSLSEGFKRRFFALFAPILKPIVRVLSDWKTVFIIASIAVIAPTTHYIDKKLHIVDYLTQQESTWFDNHYAALDPHTVTFADWKKRNLIVIFLESMEIGFRDAKYFEENLTTELVALEKEGAVFRGYQRTPGSYFTIDGLSAQLLGVPVIAQGFEVHDDVKYSAFLPRVPSVFNVLKDQGYLTSNFSGITREFTSKGDYFKDHGIIDPHFKEDWLAAGYKLDDNTKGTWDFNDHFLWERMKDWLENHSQKDQPFAVVFETVDTHQPNGWVPLEQRHYGDLRDAIKLSSQMTFDFVSWAKKQPWFQDTVIVIVGDHPWQDPPTSSFSKLAKQNPVREIYNLFLNSPYLPAGTVITPEGGYTPMDMAPTILASLGIHFQSTLPSSEGQKISNSRMGLGASLLSQEPTLISREGMKPYNEELLQKHSPLYQKLFW